MISRHRRGALSAAALIACTSSALAHAVLERREAAANAPYRAVLQIAHGCGASPTISVRVTIPESAVGARPMAKPGWTIATARGPYARAYPALHGGPVSEGVREITWSGGSLPADQFDEFVFSVRLADTFRPGEIVSFPTVQTCETGQHAWVEVAAPGQDRNALAAPAPSVRIAAATAQAAFAPAAIRAGDLAIERPWLRATPGGAKVAGGYVRITNTGTLPDRLVAASIPLAARGEVHEMASEGGVMKMRPVEGGLAIAPGETVELKPGGFHLMFIDLRSGVREGEPVSGTLVFERAGTVAVTFEAARIGAPGPAAAGGHAHH